MSIASKGGYWIFASLEDKQDNSRLCYRLNKQYVLILTFCVLEVSYGYAMPK